MGTFYKSAENYYNEMESTLNDVDNSEYSFIRNANMPVAYELSYQSMILDEVEKKIHAKTALDNGYDEDLIKRCRDFGIEQILKIKATGEVTLTGNAGSKFPAGALISKGSSITYITDSDVIIGDNGSATVTITASDYGSKYNCDVGDICNFSVKYEGILSVTNEKEITNGYDDEEMEHLYQRYKERVQTIIVGGNANWYKSLAKEVTGVGDCKPYECTNANREYQEGHVLLVIIDSNKRQASEELLKKVSDYIETKRLVGAKIHVISANEVEVNISCDIAYDSKIISFEDLKISINNKLADYFKSLEFNSLSYVSISKINSIIFAVNEVLDVRNLKLNNIESNIELNNDEIPVMGTLDLSEV